MIEKRWFLKNEWRLAKPLVLFVLWLNLRQDGTIDKSPRVGLLTLLSGTPKLLQA